jgi:hypothetical protein
LCGIEPCDATQHTKCSSISDKYIPPTLIHEDILHTRIRTESNNFMWNHPTPLFKYLIIFFLISNSHNIFLPNVLYAGPSGRAVLGVGLRPLACWDCGFEFQLVAWMSLLWVSCFVQVQVSATSWSLVQRSPT